MLEPHIIGQNAIRELAIHLYKYPESAIKEAVTNGLDEQLTKDKNDRRIEIRTHVGPTDDIWIEDYGFGIADYEKFKQYLTGSKIVSGHVSSYEQIDPEIGGNKGVGKLGFLLLAGGEEPLVEFFSHRPAIGDERRQGLDVKMTFAGFDKDPPIDATEALPHAGVRVIIKHPRYDLLPKEGKLIKYLSEVFAIRIRRGTKIYFDGNKIDAPEDFDSREYDLFPLSDGTYVRGNIKNSDKAEIKNVKIYHKTIYVDSLNFEHKAKGWINDNFIVPTTSREGFEETSRWADIQTRLRQYLDENFEKPATPKIGHMGKEKEKKALIIKGLQHMKHLLSGHYDPKGVYGEITGGLDNKGKLEKKTGVKLTNTGSVGAEPVIPIGTGTRGTGTRHGGIGTKPGYEENGDHDILTTTGNNPKMRNGPISPDIAILVGKYPEKPIMAEFNPNGLQLFLNTHYPQVTKAHNASGPDWAYLTCPVLAQAFTNLNTSLEKRSETITVAEWQKRYAEYMKFLIEESKR